MEMITRRLQRPLGTVSQSSWICPSCTRASRIQQRFQPLQRRKLHTVPLLANYDESFKAEGIPGLYSPTGFQIAWTVYQKQMATKLNELTAGEPYEHSKPKDILLQFARDSANASLFNHASMAFNNHFYFSGLSTLPVPLKDQPQMQDSLEDTFGSIDTLRATMLDAADAMFGPGFVWLVWVRNQALTVNRGEWRLLNTYLAGTPFPEAGFRRQGLDMNASDAKTYHDYYAGQPVNDVGAFGGGSKSGKENAIIPPGGKHLVPVLCVNTWEHAYIYDYGLGGKRRFLADWWDAVDWKVVRQNTPNEVFREFEGVGTQGYRGNSRS